MASKRVIAPLLQEDIARLVWRPVMRGARLSLHMDRFGAPKGIAHEPYAVERRKDRKGNVIDVILTRPVDLKAQVRAAKKAAKAGAA